MTEMASSSVSPTSEKENIVASVSKDYGAAGLSLRQYQIEGIKWLIGTWQKGQGGLLCDDMGLGKTCQVIHMLKYVHSVANVTKPSLVIVPLSVFKNWQDEFKMWAPKLDLRVYSGSKEERPLLQEDIKSALRCNSSPCMMVLLCTPELLINDEEFFTSLSYAAIIFDEAQRVKNADSLLYNICKSLQRHTCVLMTGTPVQNNVRELYALLSLAAPTKFPSSQTDNFICRYPDLVNNADQQKHLQSEIAPFMLRRLKSEAEPNLPSRDVVHLYVTLSALQKKLYRSILARNIEALTGGIKTSRNNVQNALVCLRKCVDHPYLFDGVEPEPFEAGEHLVTSSGKLFALDRLLAYLKPLGHRVLIFSQMTHMLDIIQDYLTYRDILYERLDGSVRGEERYLAVSNFCRKGGDKIPLVFLLSTKAGGVGLNLVSADTVVLFDSDVNPQNDLQAIARAHRIGQTKGVKVIRFVARHTVEENILRRQSAKMCLSEAIVGGAAASSSQAVPGFEMKNWWQEVLRIGLDKLFSSDDDVEGDIDFEAILGRTTADGCWVADDDAKQIPDSMLAEAEAEKESGGLTSEDLTAPLLEGLKLEAEQIRMAESSGSAFAGLTEGKRKSKKTEFLADEMLKGDMEPKPPRKAAPRVDPAIRRAQAKEKLWQRLDYKSINLSLPENGELELDRNPIDDFVDDEDVDFPSASKPAQKHHDHGSGIKYVVGDVTKPESHLAKEPGLRHHCIVCAWVDDGGSWGSGGVFTAIDNALGDKPAKLYELADEAKDLNVGDVHLVEDLGNSADIAISCAFLVCQHRKPSGEQKPIELSNVETVFKRLKHFLVEHEKDKSVVYSVHLPRVGRGPLAARWYGIERLVRKWFCHGTATPFVYYFSRGKAPHSAASGNTGEESSSSPNIPLIAASSAPQQLPPSPPAAAGFFDGLKFCLKYLPQGCRALNHIEGIIKKFGGSTTATPSDNDHCYVVVDRSDLPQASSDELKPFSSQAHVVHYAWLYSCEKADKFADISKFKVAL